MNSFPPGTGVFFTDPKSNGFNSAMMDILSSANDIQTFIDNKMEQSENDNSSNMSHGNQKLDEKMSKRSKHSTDEQSDEGGN